MAGERRRKNRITRFPSKTPSFPGQRQKVYQSAHNTHQLFGVLLTQKGKHLRRKLQNLPIPFLRKSFPLAVIYTRILLRSLGSSFRITSSFRSKLLRAVAIRAELMPIAPLIYPGGMGPWWVSRYCKTKASPRHGFVDPFMRPARPQHSHLLHD